MKLLVTLCHPNPIGYYILQTPKSKNSYIFTNKFVGLVDNYKVVLGKFIIIKLKRMESIILLIFL